MCQFYRPWGSGGEGAVVPLELLLSVGKLAKRYMVSTVLSMSTQALKGRLHQARTNQAVSEFEQVWAAAISCANDPIRLLAMTLARSDFPETRNAYDTNKLCPEVAFELEAVCPLRQRKIRRLLL